MDYKDLKLLDKETLKNVGNSMWMRKFEASHLKKDVLSVLLNEKNSNMAFGRRSKGRLENLKNNPESYTPNYQELYETLLKYTDSLSPQQAYAMSVLLGPDSAQGYEEIPSKADLKFPGADAPQFEYQVGWHFFVGSCWDVKGEEYGVEFMFWQHSLLPPSMAWDLGLSILDNQILELHLGISKAGDKHYRTRPIVIAGTTGLINFEGHPFQYHMGKNYIKSLDQYQLFPLEIKSWGIDLGFKDPVELEINLFLDKNKDYILQGKNGCSPCCGGVGTLYYSVPSLNLDHELSHLRIGDEEVQLEKGKFWYDHQWGTGFLPSGSPRRPVLRAANNLAEPPVGGWDWFMAQFDNNHELTFYALHSPDKTGFYQQTGPQPPGMLEVKVGGKYVTPDNLVKDVKGTLNIDRWVKSDRSQDPELYPVTNTWYPDRWHLRFEEDVPSQIREFNMTPIVEGGQSGYFATGLQYSEGAVYLKNPDGKLIGRGFAESTNYADTMFNVLRLAGLPATDEILQKVKRKNPSQILKLKSFLYLNWPSNKKKLKKLLVPCLEGL
ncbi:MAG TPA: lipocalin-like domain-containing protein [Methanobacteriaceae archaeon]|nr:lipocalin-like domain-containing protein [Methanobacteriaceae archaeon]